MRDAEGFYRGLGSIYTALFPVMQRLENAYDAGKSHTSPVRTYSKRSLLKLLLIALHQIAHLKILPPIKAHAAIRTFPHLGRILLAVLERRK